MKLSELNNLIDEKVEVICDGEFESIKLFNSDNFIIPSLRNLSKPYI